MTDRDREICQGYEIFTFPRKNICSERSVGEENSGVLIACAVLDALFEPLQLKTHHLSSFVYTNPLFRLYKSMGKVAL